MRERKETKDARTVRAVLVGCGKISGAWLDAAKGIPHLEIVGLVDLDEDRARLAAETHGLGGADVGRDFLAMLERTRPDAVFDLTVPEAHIDVALTALDWGCHVLGEKPLAHNMEAAHKIVEAAERAGKIHAVIQNRRFDPNIRSVRRFIEEGAIGPLTTVHSDFYLGAHFGGFRDRMKHVLLLDMAIHTFDAARLISGADPRSVSAVAIFEMTGGLVYTYRGSWCAEGLNTGWDASWHLVGQRGSLRWDGGGEIRAQVVRKTGEFLSECDDVAVPLFEDAEKQGGHGGVIREFLDCVLHNGRPETAAADNIKSLAMVFGAIASAEKNGPVDIAF